MYLDEAGSNQVLTRLEPSSPPVFVLGGITVLYARQRALVWQYLDLKEQFSRCSTRPSTLSEHISREIKGCQLRRDIREGNRRNQRYAITFLNNLLDLLAEKT